MAGVTDAAFGPLAASATATPVDAVPVAPASAAGPDEDSVLRLRDIGFEAAARLLESFGLSLLEVPGDAPIPGSFWGDDEAGLIGTQVFARHTTPVHSLLHEACHLIVMPPERRGAVHTDATDCDREEDATCCLQIILADRLPGVGRDRLMADMDAWGYSFRLGSARAWFEHDADDARAFLRERGLPCV